MVRSAKRKPTRMVRSAKRKTTRYVIQERGNPATSGMDESKWNTVRILMEDGRTKSAGFIRKRKAQTFQTKYESANQNAMDQWNMETRIKKIGRVIGKRKTVRLKRRK